MALNFQPFLLIILTFFVASLFSDVSAVEDGRKGPRVGGWQAIKDPNDPTIQEIGKFAVTEYNKAAKTGLTYEDVVKGETQVVAGMNYRLVIAAKDGAVLKNYQAVIYDRPWQHVRKLTSFKQI